MFDTLTTEEKVLGGGVLLGLGLLAFVKPARNAVGLADRVKSRRGKVDEYGLRAIKVWFDDGTSISTNMSKNLTNREMKDYYKVGRKFGKKTVIKSKILSK
jgi:hypothetical protein